MLRRLFAWLFAPSELEEALSAPWTEEAQWEQRTAPIRARRAMRFGQVVRELRAQGW